MAIKIGINGFGRIGKLVFRAAEAQGNFEVVGINDLMTPASIAYMLKYDSTQGQFNGTVEAKENAIVVNGKEIPVTAIKDPATLPWKDRGAEIGQAHSGIPLALGQFRVGIANPPLHIAARRGRRFRCGRFCRLLLLVLFLLRRGRDEIGQRDVPAFQVCLQLRQNVPQDGTRCRRFVRDSSVEVFGSPLPARLGQQRVVDLLRPFLRLRVFAFLNLDEAGCHKRFAVLLDVELRLGVS